MVAHKIKCNLIFYFATVFVHIKTRCMVILFTMDSWLYYTRIVEPIIALLLLSQLQMYTYRQSVYMRMCVRACVCIGVFLVY